MILGTISFKEALRLLQDARNQLVKCDTAPDILIVDGNPFYVSEQIKVVVVNNGIAS